VCVSGDMLFFMRSRISARGGFRDGKVCVEVDSGMARCVSRWTPGWQGVCRGGLRDDNVCGGNWVGNLFHGWGC